MENYNSATESPRPRARPMIRQVRPYLQRLDRNTRTLASERPFLAVALALTAGYVVGRAVAKYA